MVFVVKIHSLFKFGGEEMQFLLKKNDLIDLNEIDINS